MRLLPRSPRAVVLLAALVWLDTVLVAWTLLPIVPRHRVILPGSSDLLAVGPEARTVVTCGAKQVEVAGFQGLRCGPIRFHDADTGRLLGAVLAETDTIKETKPSPDGRWLFVTGFRDTTYRPVLVDLVSRREVSLPADGEIQLWSDCSVGFSPDGRLLAYRGRAFGKAQILLWDLRAVRSCGALPDVQYAIAFSADGRWVAGTYYAEGKAYISVIDADTLRPRATITTRTDETIQRLELSDDGAHVIASASEAVSPDVTVRAWDVATGKECLEVPSVYTSFAVGPSGRNVITEHYDSRGHYCRWIDLTTGAAWDGPVIGSVRPPSPARDLLSPDRRRLAVRRNVWAAGPWERFARQIGVPWPFPASSDREDMGVYDAATGGHVGDVPGEMNARWSPDGRAMAVLDGPERSVVSVWDVPPRKPVAWFAAGAAAWGLLLIGAARRWLRQNASARCH
jgi:WD40 repeat protein